MEIYNVRGSPETLKRILNENPWCVCVRIEDRFSTTDWNVEVPDDLVDRFSDWCEDVGLSCDLV